MDVSPTRQCCGGERPRYAGRLEKMSTKQSATGTLPSTEKAEGITCDQIIKL